MKNFLILFILYLLFNLYLCVFAQARTYIVCNNYVQAQSHDNHLILFYFLPGNRSNAMSVWAE